jgi:hypothetical protein
MDQESRTASDRMRQLLEMATSCGRNWQSSQTGFIHYSYNQLDEDCHHGIPLYENLLYALALMRSRHTENVNEGKEILSKILHFQHKDEGKSKGNFPIYIHDFPRCYSSSQAVRLLPVLYWIHKNFHHILGGELKGRLEISMKMALENIHHLHLDKTLSYALLMKAAACLKAVGHLFHNSKISSEGDAIFKKMERGNHIPDWNSPSTLGDILIAMQMVYPSLSESPEKELWEHLSMTWHRSSQSYCGLGWNEFQRGNDPQPTIYDYFLGYFGHRFSYRGLMDYPVQLQAALVHPSDDELPRLELPAHKIGKIHGLTYLVCQNSGFAYSASAKDLELDAQMGEKGFHLYKLLWGSDCNINSLVCQGTNSPKVELSAYDYETTLFMTLPPKGSQNYFEKNQEISLFVNQSENLKITVRGTPATTFRLGEELIISDNNIEVRAIFSMHEGHGSFFGHIMKGNRHSQTELKGPHRFDAYDWQIFLRSILRDKSCVIKVQLQVRSLIT